MDIFEGTPKISNTFKPCKYGQWKGHSVRINGLSVHSGSCYFSRQI